MSCLQIEEQKAEMVSRRLVAAGTSLIDALYTTHADSGRPAPPLHGWVHQPPILATCIA